jgi:hypothetical protein
MSARIRRAANTCAAFGDGITETDIAVGALEEGLLPLSQWAMRFYNRLRYYDYEGVSLDLDERERLQQSIGNYPVLVLRNCGLLATGRNIAEAFSLTYHFERSAGARLKIMAAVAAGAKLVVPSPDTCELQAALFTGNEPRLQGQREWPAAVPVAACRQARSQLPQLIGVGCSKPRRWSPASCCRSASGGLVAP